MHDAADGQSCSNSQQKLWQEEANRRGLPACGKIRRHLEGQRSALQTYYPKRQILIGENCIPISSLPNVSSALQLSHIYSPRRTCLRCAIQSACKLHAYTLLPRRDSWLSASQRAQRCSLLRLRDASKPQTRTVFRRANTVGRNSTVFWDGPWNTADVDGARHPDWKDSWKIGPVWPLLNRTSGLLIRNPVLLYKQLIRPMMEVCCWWPPPQAANWRSHFSPNILEHNLSFSTQCYLMRRTLSLVL
jgi:hypothetical protein